VNAGASTLLESAISSRRYRSDAQTRQCRTPMWPRRMPMRSISYCCADMDCDDNEDEDVELVVTADDNGGLGAGPFAVDGGGTVR
jgi:hypothetical protein